MFNLFRLGVEAGLWFLFVVLVNLFCNAGGGDLTDAGGVPLWRVAVMALGCLLAARLAHRRPSGPRGCRLAPARPARGGRATALWAGMGADELAEAVRRAHLALADTEIGRAGGDVDALREVLAATLARQIVQAIQAGKKGTEE